MESFDSSMHDLLYMKSYLFEIPNYQRSYVWEKDEITAFLKDITYCYEQNSAGQAYDHFFGQMVFRELRKDRADRTILEVVDGQQRLTTITLIVAAVYRLIFIKEPLINESVREQLRKIKNQYLISTPDRGSLQRVLTLSVKDNPILIAIATTKEEKIEKEFNFECLYESHTRILNAYTQIFKYLEKYFSGIDESSFSQVLSAFIEIILRNFSVVLIKSKSIRYSYALYQVVNDRGVSISKAYHKISESICSNPRDFESLLNICKEIQTSKGVEITFSAKMDDSIYSKSSTSITKYLLYLLELFEASDIISEKVILERDSSMIIRFDKITTEHIAARSGADGNAFSDNERDCLGNLTLLGENKNNDLDHKPFALKQDVYTKSPFALTRAVGVNLKWEREEFIMWQKRQKDSAVKIFII